MAELLIRDEEISRRLLELASEENRPVEAILNEALLAYKNTRAAARTFNAEEELQRYRRKMYAKAREYWVSVGDQAKAALTDEELDEQFWLFDGEDVPRLKAEQGSVTLPQGSLHELAQQAAIANIEFEHGQDEEDYDEFLNEKFGDYLTRRNNGDYSDL